MKTIHNGDKFSKRSIQSVFEELKACVPQGWCTKENEKKVFDPEIATAIQELQNEKLSGIINQTLKLHHENRKLRIELQRYRNLPIYRLGITLSNYISFCYFYMYLYIIRYVAGWIWKFGFWLIDNDIEEQIRQRELRKP